MLVADWLARVHRELIVNLAARHRMPAIYAFRVYVAGGGLMFFGPDATDPYRRAASYVDRILEGENPSALSHVTGCSCACADLLLGARKWTPF